MFYKYRHMQYCAFKIEFIWPVNLFGINEYYQRVVLSEAQRRQTAKKVAIVFRMVASECALAAALRSPAVMLPWH